VRQDLKHHRTMTWTLRRAQAPRAQRRERKQARVVVQESGDFLARWRFRLEQPALDESLQVFAG